MSKRSKKNDTNGALLQQIHLQVARIDERTKVEFDNLKDDISEIKDNHKEDMSNNARAHKHLHERIDGVKTEQSKKGALSGGGVSVIITGFAEALRKIGLL